MKNPSENQSQEVLAGLVERVTYHNIENGFCVLRAKARGYRDVVTVVMLAGTAWQPVRAEDSATQQGSDSGSCARSAFRVLIDVGHTAASPGADSARGVPEYEFNLELADVIAQSLRDAGFDKTVRLVTGTNMRTVYVDNSTTPVIFWVGSNHARALVKVEPLD